MEFLKNLKALMQLTPELCSTELGRSLRLLAHKSRYCNIGRHWWVQALRKANLTKSNNKQSLNQTLVKELKAGPTGIEPATPGLKVRCSSLTELRTRARFVAADRTIRRGFLVFRFFKRKKRVVEGLFKP